MILANTEAAFATLLNMMAVPSVFLICLGGYFWRRGWQEKNENRARLGRMLLMFGVVFLTIVLILCYFIAAYQPVNKG